MTTKDKKIAALSVKLKKLRRTSQLRNNRHYWMSPLGVLFPVDFMDHEYVACQVVPATIMEPTTYLQRLGFRRIGVEDWIVDVYPVRLSNDQKDVINRWLAEGPGRECNVNTKITPKRATKRPRSRRSR